MAIRAESRPEQLREFTPEMRKIRNDYLVKQAAHKSQKQTDDMLDQLKNAFTQMVK